jgi:hypothetical protein
MRKNLMVLLSFLVFGAYPSLAFAQEAVTTNTTLPATDETQITTSNTVRAIPLVAPAKKATTARQELKDAKETMRETMVQARSDFKQKLSQIKDQRKQAIMTKLDNRINTINKNRTDKMTERIERLDSILGKISTDEATLKLQGTNTTLLHNDVTAAQTAIDAARQVVSDQAAKDYIMDVTTDDALKNAASTTIQEYITDMKAVYTKVVAAQSAVVKAHADLAKLEGVSPKPSQAVTPTVTETP